MKTLTKKSSRAAQLEILNRLGHDITGSLQAGLDERMIDTEDDEVRQATVFSHPGLMTTEVLVHWENEA